MSNSSNKNSDTTNSKERTIMAKKTVDPTEALVDAFREFLLNLSTGVLASAAEPADVDEDVEEVDEDGELETPEREHVESLGIKDLRELAAEYGIEDKKKADILAAFEEFYDEDEEDVEDDEDEDDEDVEEADEDDEDEDDEDGEGDEYTRDDLEEMTLAAVRKVAKEAGWEASDYKGMDQDAIIDLILGEGDEDDEDEDEADDEDDDDVEELDEDALLAMTHKELIGLAKELDITVPKALTKDTKVNHKKLVAKVLDEGEEEE